VVVPDIQAFPRAQAARERYLAEGFRASVSVPLRSHRGTVLGAFTVSSRAAGAPSPEAMDQIEFFANLAGLALDRVDLAARLQVEHVQRTQTEALYRTLVEDGLDGVYLVQDGKFQYASAKLEQTLAYGPGELLGMPMERIIHPEDLPRVVENLRRRLTGEVSTLRYPVRAIRKDGAEIPVEVQGSRVMFEGRPAVLGVAHDNRDRVATQAALQKNSERARILAESAQAFGLAQDEASLLQALFQGAQNLTGLPHWWHNRYDAAARASVTTHWSPELSARFSEDRLTAPILLQDNPMREDPHLNRACVWIEDCREVPEFSSTYLAEIPHRAMLAVPMPEGLGPAGALFGGTFADEPAVVLDEDQIGAVRSLAGSAGLALSRLRALAEAQARETEYRQLFDQAAEPVLIAELDGTWVRVNQAACAVFGYTEAEFLGKRAGFSSPEVQPDGRPTRDVLALFTAMGREGRRGGFDFTSCRKDGTLIHCELSVAPLQKEGRTLVQVVLRDRTEARRAAEEKAALERQLYEAKKMESLGVMASGVAHDFNNLLMGVLGNAGMALEELGPAHPLAANLQAIQDAAHRASDLTRQLMAYTGRGQFSLDELDLSMEVREMRQLLEAGLPPGITLELDLAPEMPSFEGDHHQVQQVLANLLVNATEAIGDQAGWVRITTTPVRLGAADIAADLPGQELEPGDFVRLEIRDSGPGMDPSLVGRVFEPFFTTKFQGRGLGLPAVLGIVRGHRGGVKLDSAPGAGTRCAIYFPVSARSAP
jgi:PAS domain S-box-containing protein